MMGGYLTSILTIAVVWLIYELYQKHDAYKCVLKSWAIDLAALDALRKQHDDARHELDRWYRTAEDQREALQDQDVELDVLRGALKEKEGRIHHEVERNLALQATLANQAEILESFRGQLGKLSRVAAAARAHRNARGHQRCQELTLKLYEALEEPFDPQEVFCLPPLSEWLQGCLKYWVDETQARLNGWPVGVAVELLRLLQTPVAGSPACEPQLCPRQEPTHLGC
jgi:hypothetical protein